MNNFQIATQTDEKCEHGWEANKLMEREMSMNTESPRPGRMINCYQETINLLSANYRVLQDKSKPKSADFGGCLLSTISRRLIRY